MSAGRLAAAVLVAGALVAPWAVMIRMPGEAHPAPRPLDAGGDELRGRLRLHVAVLAGEIGQRNDRRYEQLEAAARYVEERFRAAGYEPRSLPYTFRRRSYRNIEVELRGTTRPDEIVVVGAHYDSPGDSPGADDNASGTAALLELARLLRDRGVPPERTVRFVAFTNEEPPFYDGEEMGSRVYARAAAGRGDEIVAMLALETLGTYSDVGGSQRYPFPLSLFYPATGDFVAFVGNVSSRDLVHRSITAFRAQASIPSEGAAAPASLPGIGWSDHASFWLHGYPALMITDTAPFRNLHYHTVLDTPDRLDYGRMARVVQGVEQVVWELAGGSAAAE